MNEELELVARADALPRRKRFWAVAGAIGMAATGIAGAAIATGPAGLAAGDPPTGWQTADLDGAATGWQHAQNYYPQYPLQYELDEDGWVHFRGTIVADDAVDWSRATAGPWRSTVFELPEEFPAPECMIGQIANTNDVYGINAYHGGLVVQPDGTVEAISWDAPVFDSGDPKIGVAISVNFEYDTDTGVDCDPNSTPPTTEVPTTTEAPPTTTEPEG